MCHCLYSKSLSVFQLLLALGFMAFLMPRCMHLGGGGSQVAAALRIWSLRWALRCCSPVPCQRVRAHSSFVAVHHHHPPTPPALPCSETGPTRCMW